MSQPLTAWNDCILLIHLHRTYLLGYADFHSVTQSIHTVNNCEKQCQLPPMQLYLPCATACPYHDQCWQDQDQGKTDVFKTKTKIAYGNMKQNAHSLRKHLLYAIKSPRNYPCSMMSMFLPVIFQ